jgi:hypothetical protein
MIDNELITLAIARSNNDLILRIDKNGWCQSQFEGFPVAELRLIACDDAGRKFDALSVSIDNPIEYEISRNNDRVTVSFWVNYSPDELQVDCAQVYETPMDYTLEDWKRKSNRLAKLYASSTETNELGAYIDHLLKDTLLKMIRKEMDLNQRKIEFFAKTNPEKAATLTGQVQAYQEVLTLIGLGDLNGKAITAEIRSSISQIWDDDISHQTAYAALVESRIANMGKAAVFPLLEIIRNPGSWYLRNEAIRILGLVDPQVKEKVMKIVQSRDKPA